MMLVLEVSVEVEGVTTLLEYSGYIFEVVATIFDTTRF